MASIWHMGVGFPFLSFNLKIIYLLLINDKTRFPDSTGKSLGFHPEDSTGKTKPGPVRLGLFPALSAHLLLFYGAPWKTVDFFRTLRSQISIWQLPSPVQGITKGPTVTHPMMSTRKQLHAGREVDGAASVLQRRQSGTAPGRG